MSVKSVRMVEIEIPNLQEWRTTSDGPLHVIFVVHLVLGSWSMLGFWSGNKLMLQNVFFLLCLLWSIQKRDSASPIVLSLVIDIVSILLDIIVLAVWYPHEAKSSEQFSAVMAIFNLIFRFASIYVIWQSWKERRDVIDGIYGTTMPNNNNASAGGAVITGSVLGGTVPSRSNSRVGHRPAPAGVDVIPGETEYGEIAGESYQSGGYGYSSGPPRQELPAIPPTYEQHT